MSPHHRLLNSVRGTKKTLYVVAAFYVVVGFFLAASAAVQGDRLGTFLGFIIVSGALVTAALFRAVMRIGLRISSIGETLDDVATRLTNIEQGREVTSQKPNDETHHAEPERLIDLGQSAPIDPSLIAAAVPDRESFPRLVHALRPQPPHPPTPDQPVTPSEDSPGVAANDNVASGAEHTSLGDADTSSSAADLRKALRAWKVALHERDLAGCRSMYASLVDTAEPPLVVRLSEQLESLARTTEQTLREKFAACVREQDYNAALKVGREIVQLMPDRLIAEEYGRLEAHLLRRAQAEQEPTPPLRLAH